MVEGDVLARGVKRDCFPKRRKKGNISRNGN